MMSVRARGEWNDGLVVVADPPRPPPPATEVLDAVLGALTPASLHARLRHLDQSSRTHLLEQLQQPPARVPTERQCERILVQFAKAPPDLKSYAAFVLSEGAGGHLLAALNDEPDEDGGITTTVAVALADLMAHHDPDSARLAITAALTSDLPHDLSFEAEALLLRFLLVREPVSLPQWSEWRDLLATSEPDEGLEQQFAHVVWLYETAEEACVTLAADFAEGRVADDGAVDLVLAAQDAFMVLAEDLAQVLDDEPAQDLEQLEVALARVIALSAPDPETLQIRRIRSANGDSETIPQLLELAATGEENDVPHRAALLALVNLHDAVAGDDDEAIDRAERELDHHAGEQGDFLRRARRDVLRGRIVLPDSEASSVADATREQDADVSVGDGSRGAATSASAGATAAPPADDEDAHAVDDGIDHHEPPASEFEPQEDAHETSGTVEAELDEAGPDHLVEDGQEQSAPVEERHTADDAIAEESAVDANPDAPTPDDIPSSASDSASGAADGPSGSTPDVELEGPSAASPDHGDDVDLDDSDEVDSAALIAQALGAHRVGLASWLARAAGDPALATSLACLALADGARTSAGSCVSAFRDEVGEIDAADVSRGSVRLALAAAGLRVALIAPYAGPIDLLGKLGGHLDGLTALAQLVDAFAAAAQRGVHVAGEITSKVRSAAADEAALEAVRNEAGTLLSQAPHRTNRYQAATVVWQEWMKPDGALGSLLQAVADDQREAIEECAPRVVDLRTRGRVEREIEIADHRATSRNKIVGPAKQALLKWTDEVLTTVGAWVDLARRLEEIDIERSSSRWQAGPLGDLRTRARELREPVLAELGERAISGDLVEQAVALLAGRCVATTLSLLLDGEALEGEEMSAALTLDRHLLLAPDASAEPIAGDPPTLAALRPAALAEAGGTQAWEAAFRARCERGEHDGTQRILDLLAPRAPALADKLADAREASVAEWMDRVRRLREDTERTLIASRRHGYLDEDEWSDFSARMESTDPDDRTDLGDVFAQIEEIRRELDGTKNRALESFNARFEEARSNGGTVEAAADRILARVEDGDLATADEYLALAVEGRDLPQASKPGDVVSLEAFDPGAAADLAARGLDRRAVKAAREGEQWGPLDFSWLDDTTRRSVSEAIATWRSMLTGTRHNSYWPEIQPILDLLGIEASDVRRPKGLTGSPERVWLEIQGVRRNGKAMVPDFGSHSGGAGVPGRLLMMIVFGSPRPDLVTDWVSHEPSHRPVMVWYVGNLAPTDRRKLAGAFRPTSRRRSVIVIDSTLLLYLAATGGQNFESTMRLTLPFAAVSPYLPGVAGLVPVEMFYGRDDEMRALLSRQGSSFVYGGRQLGKSALLLAAQRKFDNGRDHIAIYLDLKGQQIGVRNGRAPDEIWAVLWKVLSEKGVTSGEPPGRDVASKLEEAVHRWLATDEGRALLLLLDECDPLLEADGENGFMTVSRLKTLMESEHRRVKVVFAGLHRVQRYDRVENHPLAHLGDPIAIGPLRPQAAANLVAAPMEAIGYRFEDPELVSRIIAVCNNQPSLIVLFMKALVDRLLGKPLVGPEPPVTVTDDEVESTYLSEELAEQIRYRFDLTLGLDPAYKVIAYTLAFLCRTGRPDLTVSETELRRQCAEYWPNGFGGIGNDAFRALCDEMIGLGVLARSTAGYRLRSPNVLRLLGTDEQIQDTLIEAGEVEVDERYDPTAHRPRLENGRRRFAPMSAAQMADVLAPRNQVRVVIGADAGGLDHVPVALEQRAPGAVRVTTRQAADRGATGAFSAGGSARHTLAIVDLDEVDDTRSRSILEQALERRNGSVGVVLLAGPSQHSFWRHCVANPTSGFSIVELARLDDDTLRAVAQDLDLPLADPGVRAQVLATTGGWWSLANEVFDALAGGRALGQCLDAVSTAAAPPDVTERFITSTGVLADPLVAHAFAELVILDPDGEPIELLAELVASVSTVDATAEAMTTIELLRILGALERVPGGGLRVEPVLAEAWRRARG